MAQPEGEGAQSGAEGAQGGTGESTNPNPDNGSQSGTAPQISQADLDAAKAETENVRKRMQAADQRAAKAEEELRQLRDKDLPEQEKLKRDFEETQEQVTVLTERNTQLALENAFLKDNTYSWHNPERALKLVDLSQLEILDDGNVRGLKDALKALATSDPYLVKTEPTPTEDEKPPAGTAPGNNGGTGGKSASSKQVSSRIPALRTRVQRG